jgi:hypothetical protein
MSNLDDRLRALDPYRGAPYAHSDESAMVERITEGTPYRARRRRRRDVVLVPLATLAAATLALVGLVVTAGAPAAPLAALRLYGTPTQPSFGAPPYHVGFWSTVGAPAAPVYSQSADANHQELQGASTSYGPPTPLHPLTYHYVPGSPFATTVPAQDAYEALAPADPQGELARWATTLGVRGAVVETRPAVSWHVGSEANPKVASKLSLDWDYGSTPDASGLYVLSYVSGDVDPFTDGCTATSAANTGTVDASTRAMQSLSKALVASLGLHYELGPATYVTTWPDPEFPGCAATESQSQPILVDGTPTDQFVRTYFSSTGRLVDATTPVFTFGPGVAYPLRSPSAITASLVQRTQPVAPRTPVRAGHHQATASASPATSGKYQVTVRLTNASVSLRAFETSDGVAWFLPVYGLSGEGYSDIFTTSPMAWSGIALAVTPSEVTVPKGDGVPAPLVAQTP